MFKKKNSLGFEPKKMPIKTILIKEILDASYKTLNHFRN